MAIFARIDPDEKRQRDTEAALRARRRARHDLVEKIGIAEAATSSYRQEARRLAAEGGDDKAIGIAESRMRESADRAQTLIGALADIDAAIVTLAAEVEQIIDKRMRAETSLAVTAIANQGDEVLAALTAAALAMEAWAKEAGLIVPEGMAVDQFVRSAREQLPAAISMIVGGLQAHAKGVVSGQLPASLPRPAAPAVALKIVPAEPMTTVFLTKNAKYTNAQGNVVTCGRYRMHNLPAHLAEEALRDGLARSLADRAKIRELEQMANPLVPDEASCTWIGPVGREPPPRSARPGGPPTYHSTSPSAFTPLDRGSAFSVAVPRGAEPEPLPLAVGQRNLPEGEQ